MAAALSNPPNITGDAMKRRSFLAMLGLAPAVGAVGAQPAAASPNALLADTAASRSGLATVDASGIDPRVAEAIVKAVRDYDRYLLPSRVAQLSRDPHARG